MKAYKKMNCGNLRVAAIYAISLAVQGTFNWYPKWYRHIVQAISMPTVMKQILESLNWHHPKNMEKVNNFLQLFFELLLLPTNY